MAVIVRGVIVIVAVAGRLAMTVQAPLRSRSDSALTSRTATCCLLVVSSNSVPIVTACIMPTMPTTTMAMAIMTSTRVKPARVSFCMERPRRGCGIVHEPE